MTWCDWIRACLRFIPCGADHDARDHNVRDHDAPVQGATARRAPRRAPQRAPQRAPKRGNLTEVTYRFRDANAAPEPDRTAENHAAENRAAENHAAENQCTDDHALEDYTSDESDELSWEFVDEEN